MRTFSLGAGADTVVFESIKSANGLDTITNFTAGDKLNFKAFSDSLTVGSLNVVASTTPQALATNKIYQTTINGDIASKNYGSGGTDFSELFADNGTPFTKGTANQNKELIVVKGNDVTQIYYAIGTGNTLAADNVNLVAVIDNNGSGVTLTADNFVF